MLARVMEKQIVRTFLYPKISSLFRATGSTTAALIYLLHTLAELLQTYVRVIALDSSKAFDSIRHFTLVSKLANYSTCLSS